MKNKKIIYIILSIVLFTVGSYFIYNKLLYRYIEPAIILKDNTLELKVTETKVLNYEINFEDNNIIWTSTNNEVVEVYSGVVKGIKPGEADIIVKGSNNKENKIKIIVSDILINEFTFTKEEIKLSKNSTYKLEYSINPNNATEKLIFKSDNENICSLNEETVTALNLGECNIIGKTISGYEKSLKIIVDTVKIDKINFIKHDLELNLYDNEKIDVIIEPEDYTDHNFTLYSNNTSICKIENNIVTGLKKGNCSITVKYNDLVDTLNVKVIEPKSIIYSNTNKSLTKNDKITIQANDINGISKLVVETYKNNIKLTNKSIETSNITYTISLEENGNYTIKSYLIDKNNNKSNIIEQSYFITGEKTINEAINKSINSNLEYKETNNTILLFGSDYQGSNRKSNSNAVLNKINSLNIKPNMMFFLGDYSQGSDSSESGLKEINNNVKNKSNLKEMPTIFIQGNHDSASLKYLTKTGIYESNTFSVVVINRDDFQNKHTGSSELKKVKNIVSKMDNYFKLLKENNIKKPIFVLTHVPLHYSSRKDNYFSGYIVEVLNKYGDDLNIIFMFGHNHSSKYDDCLGGSMNYIKKGNTMSYYKTDLKTKTSSVIKFTYLNAGYIGYSGNSNKVVSCSGTNVNSTNLVTIGYIEINNNNLIIKKYSSSNEYNIDTVKLY